jgi:hypothetical protein
MLWSLVEYVDMCYMSFGIMFPLADLRIMSSSEEFVRNIKTLHPVRLLSGCGQFIKTFAQKTIRSRSFVV